MNNSIGVRSLRSMAVRSGGLHYEPVSYMHTKNHESKVPGNTHSRVVVGDVGPDVACSVSFA